MIQMTIIRFATSCVSAEWKKFIKNKRMGVIEELVENIHQIEELPLQEFDGHTSDVLDLAWSKSNCLLSSSKDKTVHLWQVGCNECISVFQHNDYGCCGGLALLLSLLILSHKILFMKVPETRKALLLSEIDRVALEPLEGKIITKLPSSISHNGIRLTVNGSVTLQPNISIIFTNVSILLPLRVQHTALAALTTLVPTQIIVQVHHSTVQVLGTRRVHPDIHHHLPAS